MSHARPHAHKPAAHKSAPLHCLSLVILLLAMPCAQCALPCRAPLASAGHGFARQLHPCCTTHVHERRTPAATAFGKSGPRRTRAVACCTSGCRPYYYSSGVALFADTTKGGLEIFGSSSQPGGQTAYAGWRGAFGGEPAVQSARPACTIMHPFSPTTATRGPASNGATTVRGLAASRGRAACLLPTSLHAIASTGLPTAPMQAVSRWGKRSALCRATTLSPLCLQTSTGEWGLLPRRAGGQGADGSCRHQGAPERQAECAGNGRSRQPWPLAAPELRFACFGDPQSGEPLPEAACAPARSADSSSWTSALPWRKPWPK